MKCKPIFLSVLVGLGLALSKIVFAADDGVSWHVTGDLSEACSCSVPCSCNFAQNPSPHAFCWALYSLDIQKGNYGDVNLDGLRLAGGAGPKGDVWYIDERADKGQAEALKQIATTLWKKALKANGVTDPKKAPVEFRLLGFKKAKIEQVATEKRNYLKIVGAGGFDSDYLMGIDGKTPVIVENNYSWNIQHGIKARTRQMSYRDSFGNQFSYKGTNSNQGKFDWTESTPIYFR